MNALFCVQNMKWQELIKHLMDDVFQMSSLEMEFLTKINYQNFDRWYRGEVDKPQKKVIRDLQEGLQIKIKRDKDGEFSFIKVDDLKQKENVELKFDEIIPSNKYPLLSQVFAGGSQAMFIQENIERYEPFSYNKKDNCFVLEVRGDSMKPRIEPNDMVLCDMDKPLANGCIVVVRLRNGNQYIKRYKEINDYQILLYSDNGGYDPMTINRNDIEVIYRVVKIQKSV